MEIGESPRASRHLIPVDTGRDTRKSPTVSATLRPETPIQVPVVALRTIGPHRKRRPLLPAAGERSQCSSNSLNRLQRRNPRLVRDPVRLKSPVELSSLLVRDGQRALLLGDTVPDVLYQPYPFLQRYFTNLHDILPSQRARGSLHVRRCRGFFFPSGSPHPTGRGPRNAPSRAGTTRFSEVSAAPSALSSGAPATVNRRCRCGAR